MILPKNETRIFETLVLDNGIKTVFVEDKLLERTIISVAVKVGSLANPKDYQGLAHFLEHMLFLGSKKYPDDTHFENAVKKYGGSSNAYTDHFETVYYFSAFNNGIEELRALFGKGVREFVVYTITSSSVTAPFDNKTGDSKVIVYSPVGKTGYNLTGKC